MTALRAAAAIHPPSVAAVACGALANIAQLSERKAAAAQTEPCAAAVPRTAGIRHASLPLTPDGSSKPPPPPATSGAAAGGGGISACGAMGLGGVSHRSVPQLCVLLQEWSPAGAQRRGVLALAETLRSRSLDAGTALELLRRCGLVRRLLELLHEPHGLLEAATAAATGAGAGRVGPPPSQPDELLRDGSVHLLALVAHLGGSDLLAPLPLLTAVLGGALISGEPNTRAQAAAFWAAACVWEGYANALARAIFPIAVVRSAGVRVEGHGAFANGIAVLLALSAFHPSQVRSLAPLLVTGTAAAVAAVASPMLAHSHTPHISCRANRRSPPRPRPA